MPTISKRMADIAIAKGYDGPYPVTTKQATIALADALSGGAAGDATTISDAIGKLGEHIGGGGSSGGGSIEGALKSMVSINATEGGNTDCLIVVSSAPISISGLENYDATATCVAAGGVDVPSGAYVTVLNDMGTGAHHEAKIEISDYSTGDIISSNAFTDFTSTEYGPSKSPIEAVQFVVPDVASEGEVCVIRFIFGGSAES